jgi:hypothetical protein
MMQQVSEENIRYDIMALVLALHVPISGLVNVRFCYLSERPYDDSSWILKMYVKKTINMVSTAVPMFHTSF